MFILRSYSYDLFSRFFRVFFFCTQLYAMKYSNLMQMICSQLFGFKYSFLKLATLVEGDQKTPFSIATTLRCRGGALLLSMDYSTLPLIRTLYC